MYVSAAMQYITRDMAIPISVNLMFLGKLEISTTADALGCPRLQVASAIARLGKRGFLDALIV
ncbi:hypothetical protein [Coleofasciculus sp. FACHB-1120]|uniref:hypothetical protein n=1 Tax=Coleofasciculus sp. FACHB-1120 TaxID=2692783 RepID=UPI001682F3F6|nr:hypothetical protein [Coleofasciculus sp. FACHB-1120]MBD2742309.1 hypothetical protein [Coleofasciculus sp. FACHB-1120]